MEGSVVCDGVATVAQCRQAAAGRRRGGIAGITRSRGIPAGRPPAVNEYSAAVVQRRIPIPGAAGRMAGEQAAEWQVAGRR